MSTKQFNYQNCLSELIFLSRYNSMGQKCVLYVRASGAVDKLGLADREILEKAQASYGAVNVLLLELIAAGAGIAVKKTDSFVLKHLGLAGASALSFAIPAQLKELAKLLNWISCSAIDTTLMAERNGTVDDLLARLATGTTGTTINQTAAASVSSSAKSQAASNTTSTPDAAYQRSKTVIAQLSAAYVYAGHPPEEPIISVCLPVHNAEKSLSRILEALINQTFQNFEILISDDLSDDHTLEIISHYASRDCRIIPWINEESVGPVANYNECLKRARGKYIKPLSQDSWIHPECLEQLQALMETDADLALVAVTDEDKNLPDWCFAGKNEAGIFVKKAVEDGLLSLYKIGDCPSRVLFRADDIGKGFDATLQHFAAVDYWLRILHEGDLYIVPGNLVEVPALERERRRWNGHYIELASEIIKVAAGCQNTLKQVGLSQDQFIDRALLKLGVELSNDERMYGPLSLSDPSGYVLSSQTVLPVAVSVLRALGRCQYSASSEEAAAREILELEERVRSLLGSLSWKMTKGLRDWNARLSPESYDHLTERLEIERLGESIPRETYAEQLRALIRQIKTSRSWKLTTSLRRWEAKRARRLDETKRTTNVRKIMLAIRSYVPRRAPVPPGTFSQR